MIGLLVVAVFIYPHLPEQVPGHWNIKGEIDRYYPRTFGAFFPPLMSIGIYLLMLFLPLIDPKRQNYSRFAGGYTVMRWGIIIFLSVLYKATLLVALGYSLNIGFMVKALAAVLLLIIGNFMGQFRFNYFVGIKTPWTLANEEVWQKTHRLGGKLWVTGSLVCLAMSPFSTTWSAYLFFGAILVMSIVPIVYSYIIYAKLDSE